MTDAVVNTSSMNPNANGQSTAGGLDPAEKTPTPRRKPKKQTGRKKTGGRTKKAKPPTSEQLEAIGTLTVDATREGMTLEEWVEGLRFMVDAYDTVLGK